MFGIILQVIIAQLKGEPYFALVLRPYKRRNVGHVKDVSLAVIHDGMHAAVKHMQAEGNVRIDFSDDERAHFGLRDDTHFTGI